MGTPLEEWSRLLHAAGSYFSSPWSHATGRLYAYQIRRVVRASVRLRLTLLPMGCPSLVKVYFTHLARDLLWAWGTIAIARSALLAWHDSAGLAHAIHAPESTMFFSAMQRHLGSRVSTPKLALTFPQFAHLCQALRRTRSLVNLRDLSILSICFVGMRFMPDVLVGRAQDRPNSGIRCNDLSFADPAAVSITLRGMKNDPFGQGHVIYFPACTDSGLPIRQILLDYMALGGLHHASPAPLIQGTVGSKGARLSGRPYASWSARFRTLTATFLPGQAGLSTKSLRKGGASYAHEKKIHVDYIRAVGCWDSEAFNLYITRTKPAILSVTSRF